MIYYIFYEDLEEGILKVVNKDKWKEDGNAK
jgi:nitrogen fixation protein